VGFKKFFFCVDKIIYKDTRLDMNPISPGQGRISQSKKNLCFDCTLAADLAETILKKSYGAMPINPIEKNHTNITKNGVDKHKCVFALLKLLFHYIVFFLLDFEISIFLATFCAH
jgi:hypothetical protein